MLLGPVHNAPFLYENGGEHIRFCLTFILLRVKTKLFENANENA